MSPNTLRVHTENCGGGDRGRVAIYRPFGEVSLSLNRTVTCMVLKANDRRTSCPCHDEFRGPRSDYVRQVALATTTQQQQRVIGWIEIGLLKTDAARRLNVSSSVVHRLWNQYQTEASVSRRYVLGQPRATTPTGDHFIALSTQRGRRISVPKFVADYPVASGRRISTSTV
ncbi:uncharacterized protein TNCV_3722261 [Trichonephila clavipes]|nr:uncharacterized protein TNCV_3722261 [Trichonephila clavipes]